MSEIYLALGSNLGDRQHNLNEAVNQLKEHNIQLITASSIIETDPIGGPESQGKFLNQVVQAQTQLSPHELLKTCKKIEQNMGREKTVRNGPRIIDIDILLYDNIRINSEELTIPHPRMWEREFVLKPLREIAPEIITPP